MVCPGFFHWTETQVSWVFSWNKTSDGRAGVNVRWAEIWKLSTIRNTAQSNVALKKASHFKNCPVWTGMPQHPGFTVVWYFSLRSERLVVSCSADFSCWCLMPSGFWIPVLFRRPHGDPLSSGQDPPPMVWSSVLAFWPSSVSLP